MKDEGRRSEGNPIDGSVGRARFDCVHSSATDVVLAS